MKKSPPRLSPVELAAARAREDWGSLWEQAVPLAKLSMKRMLEGGSLDPFHSREDMLQEALLAAGHAVRRWRPERGQFSTWVMLKVKMRLLDCIRSAANGMVGGRDSGVAVGSMHGNECESHDEDDDAQAGAEAWLVYDDPPEGLGDPMDEAMRVSAPEEVRRVLRSLPTEEALLLTSLYDDRHPSTMKDIAVYLRMPLRTLERNYADILKRLADRV